MPSYGFGHGSKLMGRMSDERMRVSWGNQGRIMGCASREGGLLFMEDGM